MCPAEVSGWVFGHDASATTPKVLLRWDDVMASSALKSALRYTACRQAVYLKIRLRLWLAGRHRRSVGNLSVIRGRGRFGPAATNRSEPSYWPIDAGGGIDASSWYASQACETA